MNTRSFILWLMVVMLCIGVAIAGAQPRVRLVLKDLDTDPNAAAFVQLIERQWLLQEHQSGSRSSRYLRVITLKKSA
ncbi:MAG: hypothetical protein QHH01_01625 [Spirochaetales bacterium]|nr:hypothetical protein [Spirochaetales bacterium]